MIERRPFTFACCTECGALADVEPEIISFNQRGAELCKHPPIEQCPQMKAAIEDATPTTGLGNGN